MISLIQDRRQDEQEAPLRAGNSREPFVNHDGDMETFKGEKSATSGGGKSFNIVCFHCGMPGLHK
jgi:hypothetical protein